MNVEGIPYEALYADWYKGKSNHDTPIIEKEKYYERYFDDYNIPFFDSITIEDLLRTYIYPYFVDEFNETVIAEKELITKWLKENNAKIYKTVSKNTASVIVQGILKYDRYTIYRNDGKKIFSSKDVIEYIESELQ